MIIDPFNPSPDAPRAAGPRVLVALVHNQPVVQRLTAQSLMGLGWGNRVERAKAEHGIAEISFAWYTQFPRVDSLRDSCLEQAAKDGFSHVLFLDVDMVFPDDLLGRILRHVPRDAIVGGLYFQKDVPYAPIALRDGQWAPAGSYRTYRHDDAYDEVDADGLREEEVLGMGCTLIPLAVLERLGPRPWFAYGENEHGWPTISEDVAFCERARAAGCPVFLDPSIECGHLFTGVTDARYFRRYCQSVQATEDRLKGVVTVRQVKVPRDGSTPVPAEA